MGAIGGQVGFEDGNNRGDSGGNDDRVRSFGSAQGATA
jgi:hypothetical protein